MRAYGMCDDLTGCGKNKTIDERTRSNDEEDTKFELFRVILWIVPLAFADAHPFSADY